MMNSQGCLMNTHPANQTHAPPTELPFMRWKRSPWLAALCILAVRAVMVQLGFFLHMQHTLGLSSSSSAAAAAASSSSVGLTGLTGLLGNVVVTRPLAFTIAFMLLFSVVIALFKGEAS